MFHGLAIAKIDFESISVKAGDEGVITAYLPERKIFAVHFKNIWVTFSEESEEQFREKFEIIKGE